MLPVCFISFKLCIRELVFFVCPLIAVHVCEYVCKYGHAPHCVYIVCISFYECVFVCVSLCALSLQGLVENAGQIDNRYQIHITDVEKNDKIEKYWKRQLY